MEKRSMISAAQADDVTIARMAGGGDTIARAALVERLLDQVRRTASYLMGPNGDADDLAQSALIRILQAARDFKGESSLAYWAERITVHTFAKQAEKGLRRRGIRARIHCPEPVVESIDEQTDKHRARRCLAGHLSTLKKDVRTAMVLHYLNGYSIQEVSELTNVPVNTVRGRLRTGRGALRKKILNDPLLRQRIEEMYR